MQVRSQSEPRPPQHRAIRRLPLLLPDAYACRRAVYRLATVAALLSVSVHLLRAALAGTLVTIANPAPAANAAFGGAVAGLGDIDGDGVPDLAVGSPGADRLYLLAGDDRSVIHTVTDPDGLTGKQFGYAVASLGDVNGDGVDDVAVGAPGVFGIMLLPCFSPPCPADPAYGRAFVISGATGAVLHKIVPGDEFISFGVAVARLGDVSGDGVPDLAVGMAPVLTTSAFGKVYAFSGADKSLLWVREEPGGKQVPSFGAALAGVGDLNGDGTRDLLVGAHVHDVDADPGTSVNAGSAYLLSGVTGAILRTHTGSSPATNDLFGIGLGAVGDQTGDGIEDYAVGEPGRERVYLFSGASGALVSTVATPDQGSAGWFGFKVAGVDDQDGQGDTDFWVSAPRIGKAYLLDWAGSVLASVADPAGGTESGGFGWTLSRTGHLGGDAPGDLIAGKPAAASGTHAESGAAFVVFLTANEPPVAQAAPDGTFECSSHNGTAILLDGSASTDPDGDPLSYEWRDSTNAVVATTAMAVVKAELGVHVFTLTVEDGKGGTDTDTVSMTVADTTAPSLHASVTPSLLWPPNHALVNVTAHVRVIDACDAAVPVRLQSIASNEPDNGLGDGDLANDIQGASPGTDDRAVLLRAERSGTGTGRVYTVTFEAGDASGNTTTVSASAVVPRSR